MADTIRFDQRFQGFTDGALGGYAAGVVAKRIDGPAEVNLRSLPPMERELELSESEGGFELHDGDTLVLEARSTTFELEIPESPTMEEAEAAGQALVHDEGTHLHPACFTCGPDRAEGDGLRLFMGRRPGHDHMLAAAWSPHPDLADAGGELAEELVWAALDCPTIWSVWSRERPAAIPTDSFSVLARQRLELIEPVPAGGAVIVSAWSIEREGRKNLCGAAIHNADGRLLVRADSLLVEVPREN